MSNWLSQWWAARPWAQPPVASGMVFGGKPGDRPTDVCIVNIETGSRLPCEVSYQGLNEKGMHAWRVATPFDPSTERVSIGKLPSGTTLTFPVFNSKEEGDAK